jgi:hypothetical protein
MTLTEANDALQHGRLTVIVPKDEYEKIATELNLAVLIETDVWVLAEIGSERPL